MTFEKTKMLDVLNRVRSGVSNNPELIQSDMFVFQNGRVMSFNDEIAVIADLDVEIEGAVDAKTIFAFLSKLPDEEVDVSMVDGELSFESKNIHAGVRVEKEIKLPIDEIPTPKKWETLPDGFAKAVRFCLFSVSRDTSFPELMCVHCKDSFVESCDNYRATRYTLSEGKKTAFASEMLIPQGAAKSVVEIQPTHYAVTDGWIHFKNESGTRLSVRTYAGDYQKLDKLFSVKGESIKFPDGLETTLNRAQDFSREEDVMGALVDVTVQKNKMVVDSENDVGWFSERIAGVKYSGPKVQFTISAPFLAELLALLDEATVGGESLVLRGEHFAHVCRLVVGK